jgi:hypothetical protein
MSSTGIFLGSPSGENLAKKKRKEKKRNAVKINLIHLSTPKEELGEDRRSNKMALVPQQLVTLYSVQLRL